MHQSPLVYGIIVTILGLSTTSITVSIVNHHYIGVWWPSAVIFCFLVIVCAIIFQWTRVAYLILATFGAIFSLIMWLIADISYAQPVNSINKRTSLILSVAALSLYVGFLAGEYNNDNGYVQGVIEKNLIKFAKKNPLKFAKIVSGR